MTHEIITKTYNRAKFFAHDPELIGVVGDMKFYEHPLKGDDVPLVVVSDSIVGLSIFWELPTIQELV